MWRKGSSEYFDLIDVCSTPIIVEYKCFNTVLCIEVMIAFPIGR
jgi:hypothetical protein